MAKRKNLDQSVNRKAVLGSLVPDEIIERPLKPGLRRYTAILMLGDISGFTVLCDRFTRMHKGGPSKITSILNNYIGGMVKSVYRHSGDVLNYSGDAFLAMWKYETLSEKVESLESALNCAVYIQMYRGQYKTDVCLLKVKLAVAGGECYIALLGDERKEYIAYGTAVFSVKDTVELCTSGDILVSNAVWKDATHSKYRFHAHTDGNHVKILGFWAPVRESVDEETSETDIRREYDQNYYYALRPSLKYAVENSDDAVLQLYTMAQVNKGLELNLSLESLTELRQVVVVFVNVVTEDEVSMDELSFLMNKCYIVVDKFVEEADGAVNKVSLFDKDLMFLVIFGLRYFKQGMVGQSALKCSYNVQKLLSRISNVKSASVGVTTGIVYCGVVGHLIRKEYTVMGLSVNKAARLMVAYPSKVVCDRETFLQSRMDYQHFVLQEPKELKGISNVGPVYMYRPNIKSDVGKGALKSLKYPLLGRDDELGLYRNSITKVINYSKGLYKKDEPLSEKGVVFYGESRLGKSRILDEINYISQNLVNVVRIDPNSESQKVPYGVTFRMFTPTIGFTVLSCDSERQEILLKMMHTGKFPKTHLCAINLVFHVRFEITNEYILTSELEKENMRIQIIQFIINRCFNEVTVIAIDNAEFVDDDSWKLMDLFCKNPNIYLVLAIGPQKLLSSLAKSFLSREFVVGVKLKGIHKWFHIGLSCQVLGVHAIPYDLLGLIEKESRGNPGWIESYLLSSIQAGIIYIKNLPMEEIVASEMVLAPRHMIERPAYDSMIPEVKQWLIYQNKISYKDEMDDENETDETETKILPVCLKHDIQIEEIPPSMDALVLLIFDRLPPFLQTFLKCCSTIGERCERKMVKSVLGNPPDEAILSAVQKLFDLRILACASRSDGSASDMYIVRKVLLNATAGQGIKCHCEPPPDTVNGFPVYAGCRFFCFRADTFKSTTYALLTTQEKKLYHYKAIIYLEEDVRRCQACRGIRFKHISPNPSTRESISCLQDHFFTSDESSAKYGQDLLNVRELVDRNLWSDKECDKYMFNNVSVSTEQLISFAEVNMANCRCHMILHSFYSEILNHSICSENWESAINAILGLVPLCIGSNDLSYSLKLLSDALSYLDKISIKVYEGAEWKIKCAYGIIYMLSGVCYLQMGQLENSETYLIKSITQFGSTIQESDWRKALHVEYLVLKLKCVLLHFPNLAYNRRLKASDSVIKIYTAECFNYVCKLFGIKNDWNMIRYCAIRSLDLALSSGLNFHVLCTSINTVLCLVYHYPNTTLYKTLENFALKVITRKATNIEYKELKAILELYSSIYSHRLIRGEINSALRIGHSALTINLPAFRYDVRLFLLPRLILGQILSLSMNEVFCCLSELESAGESDTDQSSKVWYYGICIYISLYLGVNLVAVSEVETFFLTFRDRIVVLRDRHADQFFLVALWLWCIRNDLWDKAKVWAPFILIDYDSGVYRYLPLTLMMVYEGLMLYTVKNTGCQLLYEVQSEIKQLSKSISQLVKLMPFITPRYLHLLSYNYVVNNNASFGMRLLNEAKIKSKLDGNVFELNWIEHNEKSWNSRRYSLPLESETSKPWNGQNVKNVDIKLYTLPLK